MKIGICYTSEETEKLYAIRSMLLDIESDHICECVNCKDIDCINCPLRVLRDRILDIVDNFESIISTKVG